MENFKRFALYYAPPAGAFAEMAAAWLGWDAAAGRTVAQPDLPGLPGPAATLTAAPRKYGFHGTLKPPFRLAEGVGAADLHAGCQALAARLAPVEMSHIALTRIGGFLCFTAQGDTAPLQAFAAEVVADLDRFRAPLTEAEIARRRPDRLSPRQKALLDQWGYPYVMEEFQFHLTLTDDLAPDVADATARVLEPHFAPILPQPFRIDDLCLFGEAADGQFHILHRYPLSA